MSTVGKATTAIIVTKMVEGGLPEDEAKAKAEEKRLNTARWLKRAAIFAVIALLLITAAVFVVAKILLAGGSVPVMALLALGGPAGLASLLSLFCAVQCSNEQVNTWLSVLFKLRGLVKGDVPPV